MTCLPVIHCVFWRFVFVPSNRFKSYDLAVARLESWLDSSEYVLLLNVFNSTQFNWLIKYVSCSNQFESTLFILQYITHYHEISSSLSNFLCSRNALFWLEYRSCLKIFVILVQHVETRCMNKPTSLKFVTLPSPITMP